MCFGENEKRGFCRNLFFFYDKGMFDGKVFSYLKFRLECNCCEYWCDK